MLTSIHITTLSHPRDIQAIKSIHIECFPISYSETFYQRLVDHKATDLVNENENSLIGTGRTMTFLAYQQDLLVGCLTARYIPCMIESTPSNPTGHPTPNLQDWHLYPTRTSPYLYIMTLAVLPAYRQFGIASQLLESCEHWHLQTGGHSLCLDTLVASVMVDWYQKRGFSIVYRREQYYTIAGQVQDAWHMVKRLR